MKDEQSEIPVFEQEKINAIERAADKYDEKRRLWQGVGEEISEAMHANADNLDSQDGTLVYKRGEYEITVSNKEKVKVKIRGEEEAIA